jgi:hypothetical protein
MAYVRDAIVADAPGIAADIIERCPAETCIASKPHGTVSELVFRGISYTAW